MPTDPKWRESQLQAMLALGDSPQDAERIVVGMEKLSPDDPARLPDPETFSAFMSQIAPDDIRDAMADWMVRARPEWKRLLTATVKGPTELASEFNKYHGKDGRFASAPGKGGITADSVMGPSGNIETTWGDSNKVSPQTYRDEAGTSSDEWIRNGAIDRLVDTWDVNRDALIAIAGQERFDIEGKSDADIKKMVATREIEVWNSGGPRPSSQHAIAAVCRDLGLDFEGRDQFNQSPAEKWFAAHPNVSKAFDDFGRAMYRNTQEWLKKHEVESLELVRAGRRNEGRLATSWAMHGGGINYEGDMSQITRERIPARNILSLPNTGFGTGMEAEIVVLPRTPRIAEFNPWHDSSGRFATGGGFAAPDTGGGGGGPASGGGTIASKDKRGYGKVEGDPDGEYSYGGVTGSEWDDWTVLAPQINDALNGSLKAGGVDATGQRITTEDVDSYRDLGERIQRAASENAVTGTIYRGESYDAESDVRARYAYGKKITTDRLTSAAANENIAGEYSQSDAAGPVQVLLRYQNKYGTIPGIQSAPIGTPSAEVIMPKGVTFRVARVVQSDDGRFVVDMYSTEKFAQPVVNPGRPVSEFNAHHDDLGRFAPGGGETAVALSYHAMGRIGKQGRANVTSVRDALEKLQSVKTPDGDWSYPVRQGEKLRGHLIGTDGVVKTVVGAWYKAEKLPPALSEAAMTEGTISISRSIAYHLEQLTDAEAARFCDEANLDTMTADEFRERWDGDTWDDLAMLIYIRREEEEGASEVGSETSGHYQHKGRLGKRGGSLPREETAEFNPHHGPDGKFASGPGLPSGDKALYRWSNLSEIVDLARGRAKLSSLDTTGDENMSFSKYYGRQQGTGWTSNVYGRTIISRPELEVAGWNHRPEEKQEALWRARGEAIKDVSAEELQQRYVRAVKGYEVWEMPEDRSDVSFADVKSIINHRHPNWIVIDKTGESMARFRTPSTPVD